MFLAYLLSFCVGFLSLSQEILWIRIFSFANYSLPQAFSFVLVFYLIGIALGAQIGKKFCQYPLNLWRISGIVLMISSLFDLLGPWIFAKTINSSFALWSAAMIITFTALIKAIIFPIAHHLGVSPSKQIGKKVARVYVANILGATLGPIITGMILLDWFTTQQNFILISALTFVTGLGCLLFTVQRLTLIAVTTLAICLYAFTIMLPSHALIHDIANPGTLKNIVENRHGIITIYQSEKYGDMVFGGNVYDGTTNLDPAKNFNGINRVIVLAALQKKPEHVLMIGLSIGTWLKLVTGFPHVKKIDVVEINPGYLRAIKNYPEQESALRDPRVHLHIADGRRWLNIHTTEKYDLIIMNTTFYWRAYTSNLLSYEFISQLKQHMNKNAVLAYNSTGSYDALKTASTVFPYAYLYENFIIAANFDWRSRLLDSQAMPALKAIEFNNKPLFPHNSNSKILFFLHQPTFSLHTIQTVYKKLHSYGLPYREFEVITDQNVITEYKYGRVLSEN